MQAGGPGQPRCPGVRPGHLRAGGACRAADPPAAAAAACPGWGLLGHPVGRLAVLLLLLGSGPAVAAAAAAPGGAWGCLA
jgi:hypothetical protein